MGREGGWSVDVPYSSAVLDWTDVAAWPAGRFDVVVAADVLYDADAAPRLAEVTSRVMASGGDGSTRAMGIFSDPGNRSHRGDFADRAAALGLETVEADFPGHPEMRLVQVTRVELSKV